MKNLHFKNANRAISLFANKRNFAANFTLRWLDYVFRYAVLRKYATWVMIVGVFAALSLRAICLDHMHHEICSACCQSDEMCMADPLDTNLPDDDQQNDKDSSSDHEHNGCCAAGMPLIVDNSFNCRLGVPGSSLFGFRHEGEVPPEKPYLSSEKPPLI